MSKYKLEDVITPKEGRVLILNTYWLCKNGDPKQALFYGETPQANKHKAIPDRLKEYSEKQTGWSLEVVFIPVGYRPQVVR